MTVKLKCSKCSGVMQEGLVVDLNYSGVLQSMWVEALAGTIAGTATTTAPKRKVKTITYRCSNCGYLDAYAQ